ncbi:4Fe-4S dicluster domain-containing protein [Vibrio sonorensis]|uniref:4Fe-4S dicluster domain-containing protein n=1 Tax=Vibrio sonorensis TaxID=1004316 RepID=UPI0008D90B3F|nr:4Fe-4S dicluster domain-containing protein [Vibrio sonorensis]
MLNQIIDSTNGLARQYALENTVELTNLIPPTVSYESGGHTLIIGPTAIVESTAQQLSTLNSVTLLSTDGASSDSRQLYFAEAVSVSGFLGAFSVNVTQDGVQHNLAKIAINSDCFDIVLDLCLDSCMSEEIPAPGYYPVGRGQPKLADALQAIPNLMGTFDKPKFFRLDSDLCAHSSRGVKGCDRCVSSCPAGALSSEGSDDTGYQIAINPYLCQGIGTCATACPTEAISYALPEPKQTQTFVEKLLNNYRSKGGTHPIVMFCSSRHEKYNAALLSQLPDNVIPVALEELTSVGIDTWLAALVNGANQIWFAASRHMPETILRVLNGEVEMLRTLLGQLNINANIIEIIYFEELKHTQPKVQCFDNSMTYGELQGNKRQRAFAALEHLTTVFEAPTRVVALPEGAPYGSVSCASQDCTLCMSCVAVCPTSALHSDGESPSLMFTEQDCIQCGMCEKACPENALSTTSRFNWNHEERSTPKTLHQEEAAKCIRCHKPFAPKSMITMLQNKLRGHSHFSDQAAFSRLEMCEDCRVVDMFEAFDQDPTKQLKV